MAISGALSRACPCRSDRQFPNTNTLRLRAFHKADAGRQLRRQQAVVGRFCCQLADRRHSNNDGGRTQTAVFQRYPPGAHCRFGEARPRRLLEPIHKFVQRNIVNVFRERRRDAVEHERLQLLPLRYLFEADQFVYFRVLLGINGG
jgi:hypothetical protein